METTWLKQTLFAGMTANAFKLGTVLSSGWFWTRISGCSVLYRGHSIETVDFGNVLTVAEADAEKISPPGYVEHNSNSAYFYVVRRVNNSGALEHTLSAAVKVSIDADGNLAEPQPNNIRAVRAKQLASNKIELIWYYCPLEQQSLPVFFNIYYDGGMGQIDYESPVSTVSYMGRRFCSYMSSPLTAGENLFCIRAENAAGRESGSSVRIEIQLNTESPDAISIVNAIAI
jgi:hypothetical protein